MNVRASTICTIITTVRICLCLRAAWLGGTTGCMLKHPPPPPSGKRHITRLLFENNEFNYNTILSLSSNNLYYINVHCLSTWVSPEDRHVHSLLHRTMPLHGLLHAESYAVHSRCPKSSTQVPREQPEDIQEPLGKKHAIWGSDDKDKGRS